MIAEQAAAARGALLHVRTDLGVFAVTGGDRLSWLNGLVTQDVSKLSPGAGTYGLAVGKTGKMLAELWFVAGRDGGDPQTPGPAGRDGGDPQTPGPAGRDGGDPQTPGPAGGDRVLVLLARDRMDAVREHFDRHLIMEDAEMGPPLDRGVIFAHGAQIADLLVEARVLGGDAARIDWTGRGDAAVIVAAEGKLDATVAGLLAAAGQGALATEPGWEALRVAWGLPRWGVDYDDQTLPQEASLEKVAVCFTKGCYLGQETVFMLEKRGHAKKKLVRLAVEGDAELAAGAPLSLPEGGEIGAVTSATRGTEGGWLAIGSVKYKLTAAGTELVVRGDGGDRPAHVLGLATDFHR